MAILWGIEFGVGMIRTPNVYLCVFRLTNHGIQKMGQRIVYKEEGCGLVKGNEKTKKKSGTGTQGNTQEFWFCLFTWQPSFAWDLWGWV